MDLNYLLMREQVERVRADRAASDQARAVHAELADGYRAIVDNHRRHRLADVAPGPELRRPAL